LSGINIGRVLIGGLVAGLVANGLDYVINDYLMADEMSEMAARLNLSAERLASSTWIWIAVDFIWGILLVFAYAAIRPRFGPGPKTAITSGLMLWLGVTAVFAGLTAMGVFTQQAYIKSSALSLVSTLVPSLIGARIYQE
jgi:hypothetical protein